MPRRVMALVACLVLLGAILVGTAVVRGGSSTSPAGPLHTGSDGVIYDARDRPVRLVGFTWTGTELGGRSDTEKSADECGLTWRVPADPIGSQFGNYDSMYADISAAGYNLLRIPVSWNNLEPVAPVWDEASRTATHTWNPIYLTELRSMVRKARAAGLMVILEMHHDLWSPAARNVTTVEGSKAQCEGAGMPRWLYPTLDAQDTTTEGEDVSEAANWFYRNVHDPLATVTWSQPWQLLYAAWDQLAYQFSAESGFDDYEAVVGADLLRAPQSSHVGSNPADGQSALEASGIRLRTLYATLAPAITGRNPGWLLLFQDAAGGYNAANPADRDTPTITDKPSSPGNWVYSVHLHNPQHGAFADGVPAHDDFGVTLAEQALANARAWGVPLFIGEFTHFTRGKDATGLSESDMEQTAKFLAWAKSHRVGWTFWAYVNPNRSMTAIDPSTNLPIPVVQAALGAGLSPKERNEAPVALLASSCSGVTCSFDARASSDPDGSLSDYRWTFGDGSTGSGPAPVHVYAAARTYGVSLTVTDDEGAATTTWSQVTPSPGSDLLAADSFTRTLSRSWGSADTGGQWITGGDRTMLAVAGGAGTLSFGEPGAGLTTYLSAVSSTTTDMAVTAAQDRAPTGGGTHVSVVGRRVDGAGDYRVKVRLLPTGQVGLAIQRVSAKGKETSLTEEALVPGLSASPGTGVRIRFQATGTRPTALQAKVWLPTGLEPDGWSASTTDSTSALQEPGSVGVKGYLSASSTNAPTVLQFDDLHVGPVD